MGHEMRRDVGGNAAAGEAENGKGGEGEDTFGTQVREKLIRPAHVRRFGIGDACGPADLHMDL